jgi:hypothetical protein
MTNGAFAVKVARCTSVAAFKKSSDAWKAGK